MGTDLLRFAAPRATRVRAVLPRRAMVLVGVAALAGCCRVGRPCAPAAAEPGPARPPAATSAEGLVERCLGATYNLARAGVRRASCDVHAVWDRRYFREPIEFDGRFETSEGKGGVRWRDREGEPALETELARLFDPDWLRHDLAGARLSPPSEPTSRTLSLSGENRLGARSLTFADDGTLRDAWVRGGCDDGVEREGRVTYVHERQGDRLLLLTHRAEFAGPECSEETTIRWTEAAGRPVPAEIRRRVVAGREYDDETLRLSGWTLEAGPPR